MAACANAPPRTLCRPNARRDGRANTRAMRGRTRRHTSARAHDGTHNSARACALLLALVRRAPPAHFPTCLPSGLCEPLFAPAGRIPGRRGTGLPTQHPGQGPAPASGGSNPELRTHQQPHAPARQAIPAAPGLPLFQPSCAAQRVRGARTGLRLASRRSESVSSDSAN